MRKNCENGRSMVEMLGVLAIIGVLSVGGIAGYSKAMFKHKINKTMDILSYAVSRVTVLDTMDLGKEIWTSQDAIDYGIFPDCDVNYIDREEEQGRSCPLPVGEVKFDFDNSGFSKMYGEFYIDFIQNGAESCVAFLSSDIYKNVQDDWWKGFMENELGGFIKVESNGQEKYFYGKSERVLSLGAKSEVTSADIINACSVCNNSSDVCRIMWVIRREF